MASMPKTRMKRVATMKDLHKVEGKAELVDGRIVRIMPTGSRPGRVSRNILLSLCAYEQATRSGTAYPDNVAFMAHLPHRGSFSPDVSFYTGPQPADPDEFLPEPPDFAVEVRSKGDYGRAGEKRLRAKRADYFAAGTTVVWDVHPMNRTVTVYRAADPDRPTVYKSGQIAEAEPAVPGWRMAVSDVFA